MESEKLGQGSSEDYSGNTHNILMLVAMDRREKPISQRDSQYARVEASVPITQRNIVSPRAVAFFADAMQYIMAEGIHSFIDNVWIELQILRAIK